MNRLLTTLMLCGLLTGLQAQQLTIPQASQHASVSQKVGLTDITINYHSPAVKERKVWGGLVPYNEGKPIPWRAGANENTTITFSSDVKVEGQPLAAGTYGLHMIPGEDSWTIIFSTNHTSWGSYFYKEEEDALRVTVKPEASTEHYEWLTYQFRDRQAQSARIELRWEKLKVGFNAAVDVHTLVLANMRNELRSLPGFTWQGWNQAASYCFQHNINHEEAIKWADNSIRREKNFTNLSTKAGLLQQQNKEDEADALIKEAMPLATNGQLNQYGYQMLNLKEFDKAIAAFKMNTEKNPKDPNVWDSLGEGYYMKGDKKNAIKSFQKSLSMNPPASVKANSEKYLKELGVN